MSGNTYTIGIAGGSGSGKTRFINELAGRFDKSELCLLSQDNYYRPRQLQQTDDTGLENFDVPGAIDHERFLHDIRKLKRGEALSITEYTFNNPHAVPKTLEFRPAPVLVVEGLFVHYFTEIDRELDLRIFIEAKDYLKLSRRIVRDNKERGYDLTDVLYRYQHHVMPVYENLLEPLKHRADLIIPNNHDFTHALDVLTLAIGARLGKA